MIRIPVRGGLALVVAAAAVAVPVIFLPAYRLFFLISLGIGVVCAGILYLWHKLRPLKEEDIEKKRPLGL